MNLTAYFPDKLQTFLSILLTALASAILSLTIAVPVGLFLQEYLWPQTDEFQALIRVGIIAYFFVWLLSVPLKSFLLSIYCERVYKIKVPLKELFKINFIGLTLFLILQTITNILLLPVLFNNTNAFASTSIELFLILFPLTALLAMIPLLQKALSGAGVIEAEVNQ